MSAFVAVTAGVSGGVHTPARTTAAAFPRYLGGRLVADSTALQWPGLYVRRMRFPRVVDRFLVPATAEPFVSCGLAGTAEFREREPGGQWVTRHIRRGDFFVTGSKTPYEVCFRSPPQEELETVQIHVSVDAYAAAVEAARPGKTSGLEVDDFFGRDEAFAHLCFACAEMLSAQTPGHSRRVGDLTCLLASYLVEKFTTPGTEQSDFRGGLPIRQLRKVEAFLGAHLAEPVSVRALAAEVDLSPFHFCRVFKQTTGMTPLQFATRERITRAQQMMRETARNLSEISLEVGYTNPSHFAQAFRRTVGMTPTAFRAAM
jgi:AraC family transcriptional regulator